ncbi:DNA-binding response regulator [Candidatus Epulonipiscium fishelsonii]|uniref:DNA-binding response regulator n=1 Tax=Candidatus Epulonipiscium fishelsonii TaxID=77094 RepID=A0ACC8X7S6_9FIRM|nr:DNA-binding response regulator [Epulopiscium sp. SCG-B11WGA-EpuloA1]ONI41316.1 DNA-binding response regulator [Epulopiscium sp. SCG-B05WGA-EpuloA1]
MKKKVLVVDDEKLIVKGIKFSLEKEDLLVDVAYDGEEAINLIKSESYSVIILDLMLPKYTGFEVCQIVREFSDVPIVMLTAKGEDMDKIMGLEYGADDYVTKPFNILELKARIKAILRRTSNENNKNGKRMLEVGGMRLEQSSRRVFLDDNEINLTAKEYDMLELFVTNPGKVYTREQLLNTIWEQGYPGDVRTVDVHVRRLREKIERNPGQPEYIYTKWGVGYYFKD